MLSQPLTDRIIDTGLIPDGVLRFFIRRELRDRLNTETLLADERGKVHNVTALKNSPIAVHQEQANEQHYCVPPAFFEQVLGPHLKYSCGLAVGNDDPLEKLEENMLRLTCRRADIAPGQRVLELGCGWGSLSLYLLKHVPNIALTCLTNSPDQAAYIRQKAGQLGLTPPEVIVADIGEFDTEQTYDRVVSVEMFEHVRNYAALLKKINSWLVPEGRLFVHIFVHANLLYFFELDEDSWMARHFFSGGIMPSADIFEHFSDDMVLEKKWSVDGRHYSATCEAWLKNHYRNKSTVLPILSGHPDGVTAEQLFQRWRVFFLACSELFRYAGGTEWFVGHYRLKKNPTTSLP